MRREIARGIPISKTKKRFLHGVYLGRTTRRCKACFTPGTALLCRHHLCRPVQVDLTEPFAPATCNKAVSSARKRAAEPNPKAAVSDCCGRGGSHTWACLTPFPDRIALLGKGTRPLHLVFAGIEHIYRPQLALGDMVHRILEFAILCVAYHFLDRGIDQRRT